jgi:hypothetical protein
MELPSGDEENERLPMMVCTTCNLVLKRPYTSSQVGRRADERE